MVVWIPILVAGAIGIAGGAFVSQLLGKTPEIKTAQVTTPMQVYAPKKTYAPQISTVETYAPTITKAYAPQISFAPIYQIESPYAQATLKKDLRSELDLRTESQVSPTLTPTQTFPITETFTPTATATQPTTTIGGDMGTILLLGLLGVGAFMVLKD